MRQVQLGRSRVRADAKALSGLLLAGVLSAGCATVAPGAAPSQTTVATPAHGDPLERANRQLFSIGRGLDRLLVHPIISSYRRVAPRPIRAAVHNVLQNADEPLIFLNDVLQLRPVTAVKTAARFVGNTTVGVAGIFDPATKAGLPHHDNGFGSTLGRYGVGPGPFIYVPLLGPTSLRDIVGDGVDFVSDPLSFGQLKNSRYWSLARTALSMLDEREQAEEDLRKLEGSADPYATVRSVYLQSREADIHGDEVPLEPLPDMPAAAAEPPAAVTPEPASPVREPGPAAPASGSVVPPAEPQ